jgi:hypothetical protein
MKSIKILWVVIVLLALGLFISVMFNLGILYLPENLKQVIITNNVQKVFQLNDIKMTLQNDWSLPKGVAVVKMDFTIENMSKEPHTFYQNNLSLFDYKKCRYDVSSKLAITNPLLFSETINPNTKKQFAVIFEVPQNELYFVGYADNIESTGNQIFIDKIRDIMFEYKTFEAMIGVRNHIINQPYKQTSSPKTKEIPPPPKVEFGIPTR